MVSSVEILDLEGKTREIDKAGMLATAERMPAMISEAEALAQRVALRRMKGIEKVIVSGMGGSAMAGDIAADLLADTLKLPWHVNRSYALPAFVGSDTLFYALSYSGNTEETLAATKEAGKRGARIICVTSGGKLKELAQENNWDLYLIPDGYQPRAALPYLLVPLLISLEKAGLVAGMSAEIKKAGALLAELAGEFGAAVPLRTNPVKQLAKKLTGKIPLIFAVTGTTAAAGYRWKTQFNENSKATALFNVFPELNHNEVVDLSVLRREEHNFCLLFLRDEADSERIKKRIEITKSLLSRQLGGFSEIWSKGKTPLSRILSLIYFGDLLSVYLAVLRGIDPTPVDVIAKLKKELTR